MSAISQQDLLYCNLTTELDNLIYQSDITNISIEDMAEDYGVSKEDMIILIRNAHLRMNFTENQYKLLKAKLGVDYLDESKYPANGRRVEVEIASPTGQEFRIPTLNEPKPVNKDYGGNGGISDKIRRLNLLKNHRGITYHYLELSEKLNIEPKKVLIYLKRLNGIFCVERGFYCYILHNNGNNGFGNNKSNTKGNKKIDKKVTNSQAPEKQRFGNKKIDKKVTTKVTPKVTTFNEFSKFETEEPDKKKNSFGHSDVQNSRGY